MNEDAPTNSVGGGSIAGIGVGPGGEPGVKRKAMTKYQRKNQKEAPGRRVTFAEFLKGKR